MGSLAALLAACFIGGAPRADDLADLRLRLDAVRKRMLAAKAWADLKTDHQTFVVEAPPPLPPPSGIVGGTTRMFQPSPPPVRSEQIWAFAGERRYLDGKDGSRSSFDGGQVRTRHVIGAPAEGSASQSETRENIVRAYGDIGVQPLRTATVPGDPIYAGYKIPWFEGDGPAVRLWLYDFLRRVDPERSVLKNGNLELRYRRTAGAVRRQYAVELDPRRGYLAVRTEIRAYDLPENGPAAFRFHRRWQVLATQDMGGWHLPTSVQLENLAETGQVAMRDSSRLSHVNESFDETLFTAVFEPGDRVSMGGANYRVQADGSFERIQRFNWWERALREDQGRMVFGFGAFLAVVVFVPLSALRIRKYRRIRLGTR